LNEFARIRAKLLELDLYEEAAESSVNFQSISIRSPWEYVDLASGIKKDGIFTIMRAKKV